MRGFFIRTFYPILVVFWVTGVSAQVCPVPTLAHPSIQAAVDDVACAEIVLGAGEFAESVSVSRGLVLRGASSATTTVEGQATVSGATVEVTLQDLKVDATCQAPLAPLRASPPSLPRARAGFASGSREVGEGKTLSETVRQAWRCARTDRVRTMRVVAPIVSNSP